jgi:hypothetical protein
MVIWQEQMSTAIANGSAIDDESLARVNGNLRRALMSLGLVAREVTPEPPAREQSLADILAEHGR